MTKYRPLAFVLIFSIFLPSIASYALLAMYGDHAWVNEPLHSAIESAGSIVAVVLGGLLMAQDRHRVSPTYFLWIASALLAMGVLDGFHALIHVSGSFFWTRGLATFFGGVLLTLVWLPDRFTTGRFAKAFPWIICALSGLLGLYLDLNPKALPQPFDGDGKFSVLARFVNVVGGIGYLIAAPRFLIVRSIKERGAPERLILASQCLMLGIAGLLFAISNLWTAVWWLFHFLRFFSYLVVLRYVFASYDQAQRRELESNRELQTRNVELASSNQELEAFCYSVSHDLRAPLRGIDGFSQALLEDFGPSLDQEGVRYIGFIREGVQRMGRLIDDLLNLSRLTRAEMRIETADLSVITEKIAARARVLDPSRTVEFSIAPDLTVNADRGLIEVCLENLIGNAWKFTGKQPNAKIEIGSLVISGELIFFVRDNGAGFDMAYANKLFGAFQRLHSQDEFPGTGVGLATVRRILQRHGGRVWAESKVKEGTTFYFTLPKV